MVSVRKRDVCADREADENIAFTGETLSTYTMYNLWFLTSVISQLTVILRRKWTSTSDVGHRDVCRGYM